MRFAWTDDQLAFAAAVRDLLAKQCPASVVRAAWDAPPGRLSDAGPVWGELDAMGVLGVMAPEAAGGLGLDECALVPVLEEAGRAALPHPLVDTAAVAAPLAVEGAGLVVGAAPGALPMVVTDLGGPLVACATDAEAFLLRDRASGALYALAPGAVTVTPVDTVDKARRAGRLRWSAADGRLVTDDPAAVARAFDRGVLGTAAQLCGLAATMVDMTVSYVRERHQFGVPIGSFQAVKHHLADARLALEFARPAVARAAWSSAQGDAYDAVGRQRDVSMAKALATDAADACGRAALQCHGAIGYTVEHDLHLYLKRSWALARTWGDRRFHAERVGRALAASLDRGGED
jgi:alkylation response protein AidB-like acyl-CoA dehydrogenase